MTSEVEKNRFDESSLSRQACVANDGRDKRNGEEEPVFKKPRLDVSFVNSEWQCEDGALVLRNSEKNRPDDGKGQDNFAECVGECSACGDIGFQSELFRCNKCGFRLQHTYCSNSYNPRKRWFIGLCNMCEAEEAHTCARQVVQGIRQDNLTSPWVEKRNAVDCLLGAALRLPSAGLSNMEDLLPQLTRVPKGRRSPSFHTIEKAKRSGPSCIGSLKASKRSEVKLQTPKVDAAEHLDNKPTVKRSPVFLERPGQTKATSTPTSTGKENQLLIGVSGGDRVEKQITSVSCDAEKPLARRSPSTITVSTKFRKTPVGELDDSSETTEDNSVGLPARRSPSRGTNAVKKEGGVVDDCEEGISRTPGVISSPGTKSQALNGLKRAHVQLENPKRDLVGSIDVITNSGDRKSPISSQSAGGSECSNITEEQCSTRGSRNTSLRKSQSLKQQSQPRFVKPNLIIAKTKKTLELSRTPRKIVDLKESVKHRRSSNSLKVPGGTHFKCLSDILS